MTSRRFARPLAVLAAALIGSSACRPADPPREYPVTGQILGVDHERQAITIQHEDIPGLMPGMTMTFPVAAPAELGDRLVGELVTATLEVADSQGRLKNIRRTGTAPLPAGANQTAMATGLLEVGSEVPDAAFIDQTDQRRAFAEWRGSVTVVTFVYTTCPLPTYCPLIARHFVTLQETIGKDAALRGRVKLVSVSIDPTRDTPAVLATHAAERRSDPAVWTWLTGDVATVDRFAGRFGVGIVRPDGSTEITHNLRTTVVDRAGRVAAIYSGSAWTPAEVMADIRRLVGTP